MLRHLYNFYLIYLKVAERIVHDDRKWTRAAELSENYLGSIIPFQTSYNHCSLEIRHLYYSIIYIRYYPKFLRFFFENFLWYCKSVFFTYIHASMALSIFSLNTLNSAFQISSYREILHKLGIPGWNPSPVPQNKVPSLCERCATHKFM